MPASASFAPRTRRLTFGRARVWSSPAMKHISIFLFAGLLAAALPAAAQGTGRTANPSASSNRQQQDQAVVDKETKRPFWEATLPGGHYQVLLKHIVSISIHEYVLDGTVVVTEMTVDTDGQALPRFYYIEPVSDRMSGTGTAKAIAGAVDRGRQLVERAAQRGGTDIHNMVQKKYGISTHTKTIEYRVMSMEELTALYNSVRRAWDTGRGRRITIRE